MKETVATEDAILGLSEHVARTSYKDLPPAAIGATKTFLLDTIGVRGRRHAVALG